MSALEPPWEPPPSLEPDDARAETLGTNPLEHRLSQVVPSRWFLIELFAPVRAAYPVAVIGPFRGYECVIIERTLTCPFQRKLMSTQVPEWAVEP